ncbi:MAG: pyridoxamine kinase [Solobacterium sp.]|nr:pyridoxamine kinase [Solobacterium sp.]
MKKVVTMQDISCVGKCSLTVALPILSAMGIETAVIPTAVLSTHTMFQGFTFHDLTDEIVPVMEHWKKEGFRFDAVYTGYLGSFRQLDCAAKLFEDFGKDGLKIVDPCMADNGKLYPGFTPEFAREMAKLCGKADIICPNMTEASFLLDIPYVTSYDETYVRDVLKKLTALGSKKAVITGISLDGETLGAYAYDSEADRYLSYFTEEEARHFHGTGDIWASTMCGALVNGKSFDESIAIACDYVKECIHVTLEEPDYNTYGVNFEQAVPSLIRRLGH